MKVLLPVVALFGILLITFVQVRPEQLLVKRHLEIDAPAQIVYGQLVDLHRWVAWAPFQQADPKMERRYAGPVSGAQARHAWAGNDRVGAGRIGISEATPHHSVVVQLELDRPVRWTATSTINLSSPNPERTALSWTIEGHTTFFTRLFVGLGLFNRRIERELDHGLATLKAVAEAEARAAARLPAPHPDT